MTGTRVLALDLGTSSVRALVFDERGGAVPGVLARRRTDLRVDDHGKAELDEESRDRAVGLLRDAADRGAAVVVATHDPEVVDLCDRVVRLVDGRPAEPDPAPPADPPGHPPGVPRTPPATPAGEGGGPVA